ncbi:TPA: filamentous hemagglutinin N-terminal domain-containing protein [Campylobacter lari]|uniref:two-partner secretion domain-containing protein n=1 Tax=Campylobacter lari TaxID=201 RepID=UPI0021532F0B|nr:filamentous hemagglutinin N-terminal domain-containing protein [Campylobacter lari]MCR6559569.1 filamentous hemagglutinin N-terminal domain-containing protein [Campylobacter lari]MCV3405508.1 filamentous hemagglutinin N-terminal domain-containing protein [Campylobacter lari]MCV3430235.1 filamentous hemagglutinin N-terminal domain-containing protein [Campylobacter lari]HEC1783536.1 filamentous hemagglutinin N-terminal domain-containing protein [Campylobacter lari]
MKKLANHIILSGVTVSMLFSPLMAINPNQLPSGGKFTHGTSGTINTNGNNMYINGTTASGNHVIQWGGGFNIGKDAQVHFGKGQSGQNYLNIAHGTSKSTIEGLLNAGGNNVFLINPNGVIITKTGTINANRFVASTSSMSNDDMWKFAKSTQAQGAAFSPVFKPNPKGGNVINMGGEINAASVVLQGNKVVSNAYADYDKNLGEHSKQISANEITLQGNEVYVDVSSINGNKLGKLNIKGSNGNNFKGSMYLNASGYYYNPNSFKVFDKYTNTNNNFKVYKYVGIGSDVDWWHFAKGWNENKDGVFRNIASEYRLTSDIDFKGNQGKGQEGKDWQNYANYCIDGLGCANMIVGYASAFNKIFDGQGYVLKNINIDINVNDHRQQYDVGLFGRVNEATIKNVDVDYERGGINVQYISDNVMTYVGGFIGSIQNSSVENISLKNISEITATNTFGVGGVIGGIDYEKNVKFKNILLDGGNTMKINSIGSSAGGFIASAGEGTKFENIYVKNINSIKSDIFDAGGFIGNTSSSSTAWKNFVFFKNIHIANIGAIDGLHSGGFIGSATGVKTENIKIEDIDKISGKNSAGGFAGKLSPGEYSSIFINNIGVIESANSGGFAGTMNTGSNDNKKNNVIQNVYIKDINEIKAVNTSSAYAGGFIGQVTSYNTSGVMEHTNNTFTNITIDGIGKFYVEGNLNQTYAGGLIGVILNNSNAKYNFSNINLFFDSSMRVTGKNHGVGKIIGKSTDSKLTFNNSNFYYIVDNFAGSRSENYSGLSLQQYVKINEQEKYNEFKTKDQTTKPNVGTYESNQKVSLELPDVEKIKSEIAILEKNDQKDDLFEETIKKEIIEDITEKYYFVDIKTLEELIKAYDKLNSNSTKEERIDFIKNHLLVSKSEQEAKEVVESLDFLLAYKTNGLENAEKNGILKDEATKSANKRIQDNVKKTLSYEQNLIVDFLKNEENGLKWLVDSTNNLLQDLKDTQAALKEAISQYNAYVDLINANKAERDDAKLESLRKNIENLENHSKSLATKIDNSQNILEKWQAQSSKESNEHFVILGKFDYTQLIKPDLNEPNGNGGKDPDPKPELPEQDLDFEQTTALNLIKHEEDEEKEIGETDGELRSVTCIVSDHFKTMNPCAVGH